MFKIIEGELSPNTNVWKKTLMIDSNTRDFYVVSSINLPQESCDQTAIFKSDENGNIKEDEIAVWFIEPRNHDWVIDKLVTGELNTLDFDLDVSPYKFCGIN